MPVEMRKHFPSTGRGARAARAQYPPVGEDARRCLKKRFILFRLIAEMIESRRRANKERGRGCQWKCVSISRPRDVGPARPERSTLLLAKTRATA